MRLGTATDDTQTALDQRLGQRIGIFQHLLLIRFEGRLQRLMESHRLGCDHMHQRATLQAGENRAVDFLGNLFIIHQNDAAARSAQTLVRGRGHDMGMRHRVGIRTTGDQARVVRHIHQQIGTDVFGDFRKTRPVDLQRVG